MAYIIDSDLLPPIQQKIDSLRERAIQFNPKLANPLDGMYTLNRLAYNLFNYLIFQSGEIPDGNAILEKLFRAFMEVELFLSNDKLKKFKECQDIVSTVYAVFEVLVTMMKRYYLRIVGNFDRMITQAARVQYSGFPVNPDLAQNVYGIQRALAAKNPEWLDWQHNFNVFVEKDYIKIFLTNCVQSKIKPVVYENHIKPDEARSILSRFLQSGSAVQACKICEATHYFDTLNSLSLFRLLKSDTPWPKQSEKSIKFQSLLINYYFSVLANRLFSGGFENSVNTYINTNLLTTLSVQVNSEPGIPTRFNVTEAAPNAPQHAIKWGVVENDPNACFVCKRRINTPQLEFKSCAGVGCAAILCSDCEKNHKGSYTHCQNCDSIICIPCQRKHPCLDDGLPGSAASADAATGGNDASGIFDQRSFVGGRPFGSFPEPITAGAQAMPPASAAAASLAVATPPKKPPRAGRQAVCDGACAPKDLRAILIPLKICSHKLCTVCHFEAITLERCPVCNVSYNSANSGVESINFDPWGESDS